MPKRIAINGFGRIGRMTLRHLLNTEEVEIVAINDLAKPQMLAHLLRYDSMQGGFPEAVCLEGDYLYVGKRKIRLLQEANPEQLPWAGLAIDVVLECTGRFRNREQAGMHLKAGAKRVLLSAPPKSEDIPTIVLGINEQEIKASDTIVSNASCTTNCLAPMVKILDAHFGIEHGLMTTVHAYTANQRLQDAPHSDFRRARAAAENMIPTTTGAAIALSKVLPEIKGKITASAVRVPIACGSLTELNCLLRKQPTVEELNAVFAAEAEGHWKGIMAYSEAPLVSSDIVGNPHSCIFDSELSMVQGPLVRITGWYDNEMGYSARLAELALMV